MKEDAKIEIEFTDIIALLKEESFMKPLTKTKPQLTDSDISVVHTPPSSQWTGSFTRNGSHKVLINCSFLTKETSLNGYKDFNILKRTHYSEVEK